MPAHVEVDDEVTYVANPEQLSTNSFGQPDPESASLMLGKSQPGSNLPGPVVEQEEATVLDARPDEMWPGNATVDEADDNEATSQTDAKRLIANGRAAGRAVKKTPRAEADEDESTNIVSKDTLDTDDITDAADLPSPVDIMAAAAELEAELASRANARSKPDRKSKYMPSLAPGEAGARAPGAGARPGAKPDDPLMGTVLDGRYQIVQRVGMGGMGTVYRGRHVTINKDVAIKVLAPQLAEWPVYVERFLQEARAASMLRHPNVVTITDFGFVETDNLPYFVMEYLEGEDLRDRLQRVARMHWLEARAIILQICSALDSAHRKGVIHRDIKPENCFLLSQDDDSELVKLLDFGIAKVASDTEAGSLTSHGVVLGTVEYISPERANKQPVDARADIYSLGVLIYRMLTGQTPFSGEAVQVVTSHVYDQPPPMHKVAPDAGIAPELEAIVLKTLAKRPQDRYQTVAELANALQRVPVPGVDLGNLPGFKRAPTMPPLMVSPGASAPSMAAGGRPGPRAAYNQPGQRSSPGGYTAPRSSTKIVVGVVFLLLLVLIIVWSALEESSADGGEPSGRIPTVGECDTSQKTDGFRLTDAAACADVS